MKVHLIAAGDLEIFQNNINEFIKDKKVVDIKYSSMYLPTQFQGGVPTRGRIYDRALILYEE